jgi:hypothetical protein
MFKKSLLIIGLALSLNTQTNPFTWKNSVRSMSATSAFAIAYVAFSMSMNKYPTFKGFTDLNLSGITRATTGLALFLACAPVALLFQHAESIK